MNLVQIAKIARREYLARVRNKAFIIMTVLVPAFLGLYMFLIPMIGRSGTQDVRVAVIDAGTGLGRPLAQRLAAATRPRIAVTEVVTIERNDLTARERFSVLVRDGALDQLFIERDEARPARTRYFARETSNPALVRQLQLAVRTVALGQLLGNASIDIDEVQKTQQLDLALVTITQDGEREGGFQKAIVSTMVLAMLLYTAVLINGQGMATAIVEEKSSRLVEVILGAVTATEFMTGKIAGVLGSGLTQLAIWIAVALVALFQAAPALALSSAASGFDVSAVLSVRLIVYFAVFFSLGYLLYSVMFAVVAVTCTSTEELGHSMMAAVMPMVAGLIAALSVIPNPGSTMTRVLSFVPFFTPLVMMARVNVLMPPLWEVWLSIGLLLATSVGAGWIAAKIFRYALLMTGKRPTLPELLRVVRAR